MSFGSWLFIGSCNKGHGRYRKRSNGPLKELKYELN